MAPQSEFTVEELRQVLEKLDLAFLALIGMGAMLKAETVQLYLKVRGKYQAAIQRTKRWEDG